MAHLLARVILLVCFAITDRTIDRIRNIFFLKNESDKKPYVMGFYDGKFKSLFFEGTNLYNLLDEKAQLMVILSKISMQTIQSKGGNYD